MLFDRSDLNSLSGVIREVMSQTIDSDVYNMFSRKIGSIDTSTEDGIATVAVIEEQLRAFLAENGGFIRHQLSLRLMGFTGRCTPSDRFTAEQDGRTGRVLKDGSFICWEDRPRDLVEVDNKKHIGWPMNVYLSEVIPFLMCRQSDRIQSAEEKKVMTMKPVVAAIMNSKGGTGKTTTASHLSVISALLGFRVLVIDADPQSTASTLLGYPFAQYPIKSNHSLYKAVTDLVKLNGKEYNVSDYIRPTTFDNISIITGSTHGSLLDITASQHPNIMQDLITQIKDTGEYDLIFVDTRPQSAYQDFAQYSAADILINTMAASTTGIGSTAQGISNYLESHTSKEPNIETRKNQLAISVITGVESDSRHPSRTINERFFAHANNPEFPVLCVDDYIPTAAVIAEANAAMETVFQQTNMSVPTNKTKRVIEKIIEQFEQIFSKCIVPYWLNIDGIEIDREAVLAVTGEIGDPLDYHECEYEFLDMGFAFGIIKTNEPTTITVSRLGNGKTSINAKRFLKANLLDGDISGHQIVMKDGRYFALSYNLDELPDVSPYVLRANSAS